MNKPFKRLQIPNATDLAPRSTSSDTGALSITLLPSKRSFAAIPGHSLLHSGLVAGIALPYSCSNGSCGECKARIVSGNIAPIANHEFVLTAAEKLNGICLLCSNMASDDVSLEVHEATSVEDIPLQQHSAKICRIEPLDTATIVGFKFSRNNVLRFLPGQQAGITFPSGLEVLLPISSCPCNSRFVEFHIPNIERKTADDSDIATTNLHPLLQEITELKSNSKIDITGPYGELSLGLQLDRPVLFIATGIGFAQMQGLIEQVFDLETGVECCLVWRATDEIGHYRHSLCRSWADAIDEFTYIPLQSHESIAQALAQQWYISASNADVYLCGSQELISEIPNLIDVGNTDSSAGENRTPEPRDFCIFPYRLF